MSAQTTLDDTVARGSDAMATSSSGNNNSSDNHNGNDTGGGDMVMEITDGAPTTTTSSNQNATEKFMGQKERRRSSVDKEFFGDHLSLGQNAQITKMLAKHGDKLIIFSDLIIKVNKRNKMQERILMITESSIYNIEPQSYKMKRRILLKGVASISLSKLPDNFFALHVPSEYDYLMVSTKKCEIISKIVATSRVLDNAAGTTINFANNFDYRIDSETQREIHFSRVDGGVSTQIYTKKKKTVGIHRRLYICTIGIHRTLQ